MRKFVVLKIVVSSAVEFNKRLKVKYQLGLLKFIAIMEITTNQNKRGKGKK